MKLGRILLVVALTGLVSPPTRAELLKPIDRTKQADVNGKNVSFGDVSFDAISQPTREVPQSPITRGDLKPRGADLKNVDLGTLEISTVSLPVLPKANFTAKHAAADKQNDQTSKQVDRMSQKAPITDRQIRPFTPAGQEELKRQLSEPPLSPPR